MDKHTRNHLISDGAFAAFFGAMAVVDAVKGLEEAGNGNTFMALFLGALAMVMVYATYNQGKRIADTVARARTLEACGWCDGTGADPFGPGDYHEDGTFDADPCPKCKGDGVFKGWTE